MDNIVQNKGDVRNLLVYQLALKISVITEVFVQRFIPRGSRTIDQMQQAARSCKQNIVEGSQASSTSKETEIKLTNVAKASLGELEEDYRDYLLFHNLNLWEKDHPRIARLRVYIKSADFKTHYEDLCRKLPGEEFCNLAITLIKQTQYLLDRLIKSQEKRFLEEGGIREAMTRARLKYRSNQNNWSNQNNQNSQTNWSNQNNQNNWSNRNNQNSQTNQIYSDNSNRSNNSDNSNRSNNSNNSNRSDNSNNSNNSDSIQ